MPPPLHGLVHEVYSRVDPIRPLPPIATIFIVDLILFRPRASLVRSLPQSCNKFVALFSDDMVAQSAVGPARWER